MQHTPNGAGISPPGIASNAAKSQEVGAIGIGGSGENAAGVDAALSLGGIEAKWIEDKTTLVPDPQAWINPGDSVVVAPGGEIVSGPLRNVQGILYVEVGNQRTAIAACAGHRAQLCPSGYSSPPHQYAAATPGQVRLANA